MTVKKNKYSIFLFLLFSLQVLADNNPDYSIATVDLSAKTLSFDDRYKVDGSWKFYWNKYIFSNDDKTKFEIAKTTLPWSQIGENNAGHPAFGYATYVTKVKLPKRTGVNLALNIKRVKTAYALYIDGKLESKMGALKDYPISLPQPDNTSGVVEFDVPLDKTEISLLIHVSNFEYYRGGLDQSLVLSYGQAAQQEKQSDVMSAAFTAGALLFMGLYHFGLWLKRRSNTTSLYFSILASAVGLRVFFTYKLMYLVFPTITEELMLRLEITLAFIALPMLHLFISSVFPDESNKYVTRLSWIVWLTLISVAILAPLKIVSEAILPLKIYFLVTLFHNIYMGTKAYINKREGSLLFSIGFIVAIITGIHDMLFENNTIYGYGKPIFPFGVLTFVFIQFTIHAMRFSRAYRDLETLTNTLEIQVQDRTKELSCAHQEATKAHEETKFLSNAITNLLEDERKTIARELHDDFGQNISGARLFAQNISKELKRVDKNNEFIEIISYADNIDSTLASMYKNNRNLLRRLRPEIIDTLGLEYAIEELLDNYRKNNYDIKFECIGDVTKIDSKAKITIYRILQESITNIVKYAETKNIEVSLVEIENDFKFIIKDFGRGFDVSNTKGVGLISMRERIADIGGTIQVSSVLNKGTTISITIPKLA